MNEKPILVATGIVKKGEYILVAQRKPDSKFEANKWEFPGGKVEYLEHPEACFVREVKEELDITIEVDKLFTMCSHIYKKGSLEIHVVLLAFLANYREGELRNVDAQDSRWILPNELVNYDFAEADAIIIKRFLETVK